MQRTCLVSVIITVWNSKKYLPTCLEKLAVQTFSDFEVILVDNGSQDGSIDGVEERFPGLEMQVVRLGENIGFAAANNLGARTARGKWLALLNADAFPAADWLECLLEAAGAHPDAFFASRQIQAHAPHVLDGEGDIYHISGLAWRRNYGLAVQEKHTVEEIFSPCAAAALYPRQAFLEAGGFDEDFFSYQEDVDLGFRLRLRGLRSYFVPLAVVHHVGSGSTGKHSDFAIYYGHRNLEWSYVKNMPAPLFWIFLPLHLVVNIMIILRFLLSGHGKAIWQAKLDAARGLKPMLRKRRKIQQGRKASAKDIFLSMERDLLAPLRASIQRRLLGAG